MKSLRLRYLVIGSLLLGISMILGLWAWNTLGELFGLPTAHLRHALAVTFAALLLRRILLPGRVSHHRAFRRCRHEQ